MSDRKGTWARVVLDSLHPENGVRLTTLELNYPYIVHAEFMTHCALSRNAASSRAIRTSKMIKNVQADPFIPRRFPRTADPDLGMNPDGYWDLGSQQHMAAYLAWDTGFKHAVATSMELARIGVHKQVASRPLAPYMHIRTLTTATEWDNFFNLRLDSNAQDQIQDLAVAMSEAVGSSVPVPRRLHLPFMLPGEPEDFTASAGRCARISYMQHDGKVDLTKDLARGEGLLRSGHMSPFEHQGIAEEGTRADAWSGKFRGWTSYRKTIPGEAVWIPKSA